MCLLSVAEALRSLQPTNGNARKSSLSRLQRVSVRSAQSCLSAADGGRLEQRPPLAPGVGEEGPTIMGKK